MNEDFLKKYKEKYNIEVERSETKPQDAGEFQRLINAISNNNNQELWNWVYAQEEVVKSKNVMMEIFNAYIFESMKSQFSEFCKNSGLDVIERYVDTCIATSKEYVSPIQRYEEERAANAEMIRRLLEENKELKQNNVRKEVVRV